MSKLQSLASLYRERPYYSIDELEKILEISQSDLRKMMDDIANNDYGCKIKISKGKGYGLFVQDNAKFRNALLKIEETEIIEEQIKFKFIVRLVNSTEYLNVSNLLNEFYISRTKLKKLIVEVNNLFEKYHLQIVYIPYKGIILKGLEVDIRHFIINFYPNSKLGIHPVESYIDLANFFHKEGYPIPSKSSLNKLNRIIKVILLREDRKISLKSTNFENEFLIAKKLMNFLKLDLDKEEFNYFCSALNYYVLYEITVKEKAKINEDINIFLDSFNKDYHFTQEIHDDVYDLLKCVYLNNKYIYLYYHNSSLEKAYFLDNVIKSYLNRTNLYYRVYNHTDLGYISNSISMKFKLYKKEVKYNKIALIKSNTLLKDEFQVNILKEALSVNHHIEIFSEFKTSSIINFNPDLIVTSHLIPDEILEDLKDFRTINIKRSYTELRSEEVRNYILSYDFMEIIKKEIDFEQFKIDNYIFRHQSLHFIIYYVESEESSCKIDVKGGQIRITSGFITRCYAHALLIDEIIKIVDQEVSLNYNDKDFKIFLVRSLKNG